MNDIFQSYRATILQTLKNMAEDGELPSFSQNIITLEPPRNPEHGDMALNAPMALAKAARQKPLQLAEIIKPRIDALEGVSESQIAGAGFLNIKLKNSVWLEQIPIILKEKNKYGDDSLGKNQSVSIEYVSANPTGPLHIGHARGAVFGDALARLMQKTGYKISTEYYVNDEGAQAERLADSVFLRIREILGEDITIPEGFYPGDYLIPVAQNIFKKHGEKLLSMDEKKRRQILKEESVSAIMKDIKKDLKSMDARHDIFVHESDLMKKGDVKKMSDLLEKKGLVYEGTLPAPKGKRPDDWEPHPQKLFRATKFGDEIDRPLQKKNGAWTYFASDIAYHRDKTKRAPDEIIAVWGADHAGYIKRMAAALQALEISTTFTIKVCQMVRVLRDGKPVKMSKREGGFVPFHDVLKEIGKDALRFQMLTRKNDAPLDFDLARVLDEASDNPVFYVQYAHARICSVMRRAKEEGFSINFNDTESLTLNQLSLLKDDAEMALLKMLARFPRHIALASSTREPHRIAFYLHDLSALLHALWNKGKSNPELRFLHDDQNITAARLALLRAARIVIAEGLRLMGVAAREEMR